MENKDKKPVRRRPPRLSYHHGDLREALLAAAERVLERDGLERFTLRACAREAGVSHAAPAHHFRDMAGLTAALATGAFQRLSAFMDRYALEAAPDPRAMLPAMGVAYIDFALRHPGLYRLMFRIDALNDGDPVLRLAADECHGRLEKAVADVLAADGDRPAPESEVKEVAALAWSVVHGYASLALEGHFAATCPARPGDGVDLLTFAGRVLLRLQPLFAGRGG